MYQISTDGRIFTTVKTKAQAEAIVKNIENITTNIKVYKL